MIWIVWCTWLKDIDYHTEIVRAFLREESALALRDEISTGVSHTHGGIEYHNPDRDHPAMAEFEWAPIIFVKPLQVIEG